MKQTYRVFPFFFLSKPSQVMRWEVPLTISDTLLVQNKDLANDILMKERRCAVLWRDENIFDEEVFVQRIGDM